MSSESSSLLYRRDFLKFMGYTAASLALAPQLISCATGSRVRSRPNGLPFTPLTPTYKDDLVLADGFSYDVLIKFKDQINARETFGAHNDYLHFVPINKSKEHGLLWVNHEYLHPVLFHERPMNIPRTREDVIQEQLGIGGSIIEIRKEKNSWQWVKNSNYNRRISARTFIPFQKGYKIMGATQAMGTVANCAGGLTPWGTILTCEENYEMFYGDVSYRNKQRKFIEESKLKWYEFFPLPPEHYGWVVEVNPFTGAAVKRNALGRFSHEAATVTMSRNNKVVVYMGEDVRGGFIFKFISDSAHSLEKGT
ncbi:MAG: DUF839 domain-containing protein, partial [Bdellovibrionales bacterium]|nr:DUF839 domain-containing protein [Bdellovibrionales bacterium]